MGGGGAKMPVKQQSCRGALLQTPEAASTWKTSRTIVKVITVCWLGEVCSILGGLLLLSLFSPHLSCARGNGSPWAIRQGGWEHTNVYAPRESLAETLGGVFLAKADGIGLPCGSSLRRASSILAFRVAELSQ